MNTDTEVKNVNEIKIEDVVTVTEARKEKRVMEESIARILQQFEGRTGLKPGKVSHLKPIRLISAKQFEKEEKDMQDLPIYEVEVDVRI